MSDAENNLERYLTAERLLAVFFTAFDFCRTACILPALSENGAQPVAGCCKNRYHSMLDLEHPAFERLRLEREKLYGKPEDHSWTNPVSPCEYHNPLAGCVLPTHKSPVCISFLCRKGIDRLRSRYGIYAYDYLGVYYALEWILTGDLPESQYLGFKDSIAAMTRRVRSAAV